MSSYSCNWRLNSVENRCLSRDLDGDTPVQKIGYIDGRDRSRVSTRTSSEFLEFGSYMMCKPHPPSRSAPHREIGSNAGAWNCDVVCELLLVTGIAIGNSEVRQ
jgi:hypothetical protein